MAEVVLDPRAGSCSFSPVPPQLEPPRAWPEPDWTPLFREARSTRRRCGGRAAVVGARGLRPQGGLGGQLSGRAADSGAHRGGGIPRTSGLVRGAAPLGAPDGCSQPALPSPAPVGTVSVILALAMPLGGVLLARRNIRLGRGDRKGAFRVALFVFLAYAIARAVPRRPRVELRPGAVDPDQGLGLPLFWAAQVWLLYMALEPFARRRWPHVLISWKRLLAGKLRDPLVGRDVLLGSAMGGRAAGELHGRAMLRADALGSGRRTARGACMDELAAEPSGRRPSACSSTSTARCSSGWCSCSS